MKIIFCNIAYLKFYDGRVAGELKPTTGGRWVKENEDAHEKWNFLNYDGECFGYVQLTGDQLHIERYEDVTSTMEEMKDAIVVWCAEHPTKGTVIVGWYENATVYRYCQESVSTPGTGLDRYYWFKTKANNAYLMPEEKRTFSIGRANVSGTGKGFGRGNVWYAESDYAKENIIPEVLKYIDENRGYRINVLTEAFTEPSQLPPLSSSELKEYESFGEESNLTTLRYAYRGYANNPGVDVAYDIASSLVEFYQFSLAIPWYEKVIELDSNDFESKGALMYLYQQCKEYEKSSLLAKELLESVDDSDIIDELYCALADNSFFSGDVSGAISWLDKIIEESNNRELIEYTKDTKNNWINRV